MVSAVGSGLACILMIMAVACSKAVAGAVSPCSRPAVALSASAPCDASCCLVVCANAARYGTTCSGAMRGNVSEHVSEWPRQEP